MTVLAAGPGAVPAMGTHPSPPVDAAQRAADRAAATEALTALSARARRVADLVADQVAAQRGLLDVDWRGRAAGQFTDAVGAGAAELAALVRALEQLADDAAHRAGLLGGAGWQDGAGW